MYVTLTSASVAVLDIFLEISYLATFGEKALVRDLPFGAKLYRIFERKANVRYFFPKESNFGEDVHMKDFIE